jgi:hypothetical protein
MTFSCINCICIRGSRAASPSALASRCTIASSYRFLLYRSPLRTMYAKERCSHLFVWTWDGGYRGQGMGRWQDNRACLDLGLRVYSGVGIMRALTGLRRRWSVYGFYDNEWGNE